MPIDVLCTNCRTAQRLGDEMAGQMVSCPKCKALLRAPFPHAAGPIAMNARVDRVLGRQVPLAFDVLGLHTAWEEGAARDWILLVLSLRHVFLLILIIALAFHFSDPPERAE